MLPFARSLLLGLAVLTLPPLAWAQETLPADPAHPESSAGAGRDTTTGRAFEQRIEAALRAGGYQVAGQTQVGTRPNGGKHFVDVVARKGTHAVLISLKWQQSSGTAEQKIPYEVICLSEALAQSNQSPDPAARFTKACLVMGGDGWTLREWYLSGALKTHLPAAKNIELHTVESFLESARAGTL